ncbi:MAG: CBS domain-containing protein [Thiogranum sp.]|nr:CBS domain-containing protein [Thiogranum sp.]
MQVQDIMTRSFESISRDAAIRKAAEKMRDLDVGMLPVTENGKIVGTITDRDITIRATANGAHPDNTSVSDVMTSEAFSCNEGDDLQQASHIMEEHQVRRLLVKNSQGDFTGLLALADLARHHELEHISAEILEEVSQPATRGTAH